MSYLNCIKVRSSWPNPKAYLYSDFCLLYKIIGLNSKLNTSIPIKHFSTKLGPNQQSKLSEIIRPTSVVLNRNKETPDVLKAMKMCVLGTGAEGTGSSLMLMSNSNVYKNMLFNCGECTLRRSHEIKEVKISKMTHLFITSNLWSNVGGIVGIYAFLGMTNAVARVKIHGPPGIKRMVNDFLWSKSTAVSIIEHKTPCILETFENEEMVKVIPIFRKLPKMNPSHLESNESSLGDAALVYICNIPKLDGIFKLIKCVELNVPPGPLLLKLKQGKEVTLDDGRVITPDEVRSEPSPPCTIMVVDVPSIYYLEDITTNEEINTPGKYKMVAHFTPVKVFQTDEYKNWMETFPSDTVHLILNENNTCLGLPTAIKYQNKLNYLSNKVFPLLGCDYGFTREELENNCMLTGNIIQACSSLVYQITPTFSIDSSMVEPAEAKESIKECLDILGYDDKYGKTKTLFEEATKVNQRKFPQVVFLGTISSAPSPARNTSAILLNINENKSILLDCGDGTYGQIMLHYGPERGRAILRNLSAIYISHKHIDHQTGLFGVIIGRRMAFLNAGITEIPKIPVLYPPNITKNIYLCEEMVDPISNDIIFISNAEFLYLSKRPKSEVHLDLLNALELCKIETTFVQHCHHSYGIALTHEDWKIVYSGDTMPSKHLVNIGKDCDLLIHEATFEDYLKEDAVYKKHSTTTEAINVGEMMGAKGVILTHFSVRYKNIPLLGNNNKPGVGIAFDNMAITLDDVKSLHLLYPLILDMFSADYEQSKDKLYKKVRNRTFQKSGASEDYAEISSRLYDKICK